MSSGFDDLPNVIEEEPFNPLEKCDCPMCWNNRGQGDYYSPMSSYYIDYGDIYDLESEENKYCDYDYLELGLGRKRGGKVYVNKVSSPIIGGDKYRNKVTRNRQRQHDFKKHR